MVKCKMKIIVSDSFCLSMLDPFGGARTPHPCEDPRNVVQDALSHGGTIETAVRFSSAAQTFCTVLGHPIAHVLYPVINLEDEDRLLVGLWRGHPAKLYTQALLDADKIQWWVI